MKKRKFKELFKRKKAWMMTSGVFVIFGIIALTIGLIITGFDLIQWLQSPHAVTLYIFITLGVLGIIIIIIFYRRNHLGD